MLAMLPIERNSHKSRTRTKKRVLYKTLQFNHEYGKQVYNEKRIENAVYPPVLLPPSRSGYLTYREEILL